MGILRQCNLFVPVVEVSQVPRHRIPL
jgi:hypothetical protein